MINVKRLPNDDSDCGWWHLQPPGKSYPSVTGDLSCDYAIVGAGWTGLAAARRLADLKPDARIALLDAGRIGQGAAGRNSGFLFDVPFVFSPDAYRGREKEGHREIRLLRSSVDHMRRFVQDGAVDCDWSEIGQYHVAADDEGERELSTIAAGLRALDEPHTALGAAETGAALGTDYYRAAIHTPGTVQINPLALARAYADALPGNVQIYEQSPVTSLETGAAPKVLTATGTVTAAKLLLTTNAFLDAFSGLRPRLVPVMTFSGMTTPLSDSQAQAIGGHDRWGLVPASLFGTSMRRLADGRFLVRNTYAYAPQFQASASLRARAAGRQLLSLRRRFPTVEKLDLQWRWGGMVSFFRGANGFFGDVAPNTVAAVTSGMPVCILYGQQLAAHVAGEGGDALAFVRQRSRPGRLPPKPLTGMAARLSAALRQRKAQVEI